MALQETPQAPLLMGMTIVRVFFNKDEVTKSVFENENCGKCSSKATVIFRAVDLITFGLDICACKPPVICLPGKKDSHMLVDWASSAKENRYLAFGINILRPGKSGTVSVEDLPLR
ncbi:uncharacterized protein PV07_12617 [Cladophialophora immunda]|uniref:Uncharacterized protein n=1 Tax=Cladophialophora immunda TaxID=569365 RepID=A0A0D1Z2Z2_9EURO|nr:uncharacterized protein PV07_12617 [Cladophialophora immunda]KIW21976.1 hypothetical protein PV07_12617 [Cladophialophora immunda]